MRIAGIQRTTLIDFPRQIACTVFTAGCNLRCPWCHNGSILGALPENELISEERFFQFLDSRLKTHSGVVISGGEPTLQPDLIPFVIKIRARGLAVKLDTNGTRPDVLEELFAKSLIDYVAMDVKAAPQDYGAAAGRAVPAQILERSIELIRAGAPQYEFRVTLVPGIHTPQRTASLGAFLQSGPLYVQNFRPAPDTPSEQFKHARSFSPAELEQLADILRGNMTRTICVRSY